MAFKLIFPTSIKQLNRRYICIYKSNFFKNESGLFQNSGFRLYSRAFQNPHEDPAILESSKVDFNFSKSIETTEDDLKVDKKDLERKIKYNKLDGKSSILTNYMVNVKSRKKREKSGTILLEGKRLIEDALAAGAEPVAVFFSRVADISGFNLSSKVHLYHTPYKNLEIWSDLTTSQGVLGIFKLPDTSKKECITKLALTIICDNIRDPGNMGSILRTSAAVGCQQLLLTKGCVDLWEPKVLRSASGAHFRIRIRNNLSWDEVNGLLHNNSAVYLAESDVPPSDPDDDDTGIDMYDIGPTGEKVPVSKEPTKRKTVYQKQSNQNPIPLIPYHEPLFAEPENLVLVVGGETQGLSRESYQLAEGRGGRRIYLPLDNGIESLNSGTALGILAYEIKRQRLKEQL